MAATTDELWSRHAVRARIERLNARAPKIGERKGRSGYLNDIRAEIHAVQATGSFQRPRVSEGGPTARSRPLVPTLKIRHPGPSAKNPYGPRALRRGRSQGTGADWSE